MLSRTCGRPAWVARACIALIALACAVPTCIAQDAKAKVDVGDMAPDFKLKDQNGKETTLKALLAKKPTAIVFHRSASW